MLIFGFNFKDVTIAISSPIIGDYLGGIAFMQDDVTGIICRSIILITDIFVMRFILDYEIRKNKNNIIFALICAVLAIYILPAMTQKYLLPLGFRYFIPLLILLTYWILFKGIKFQMLLIYTIRIVIVAFIERIIVFSFISSKEILDPLNGELLYICSELLYLTIILFMIALKKQIYLNKLKKNIFSNIPQWYYIISSTCLWISASDISIVEKNETEISENIIMENIYEHISELFLLITILLLGLILSNKRILENSIQEKTHCLEEEKQQYIRLYEKQQQLRKFKHDNTAHLNAIKLMAHEEKNEQIENYVGRLLNSGKILKYLDTGNIVTDAITNEYYERGINEGVNVKVSGTIGLKLKISDTDLCTIISNCMSNAYNAALGCRVEQKEVNIEFTNYKNILFVKLTNTVDDYPEIKDGLIISPQNKKREQHGLGIGIIRETVLRCGGQVEWKKSVRNDRKIVITLISIS